jgi:hypothetical protein
MRRLKLPKYDRPIRYLCTRGGKWWEGDANRLIVAGITGCTPDDPDAQHITSARQEEMTPIERHRGKCNGTVRIVYPDSSDWGTLSLDKRED